MEFTSTEKIISHKVLNEDTGEIEIKDFIEIKKTKQLKGGFMMVYQSYDETLVKIVKSNLDLKILLAIRKRFTYKRIEVVLSSIDLSKELNTSIATIKRIIKKSVDTKLLMRVDRGTYRLNPFMYLPYRCNGEELQREWIELENKLRK